MIVTMMVVVGFLHVLGLILGHTCVIMPLSQVPLGSISGT